MTEATPRPWQTRHLEVSYITKEGTSKPLICALHSPNGAEDAELIVRAVNAHDDLLAALEAVFPLVTERCGGFTHTHYQNGEITEKSRNEKADRQALFDKVAAALTKGKGTGDA